MWLLPPRDGVEKAALTAESGVVGVVVEMVGPDLLDDGLAKVADRRVDALELRRLQAAENRPHPVLLQGLDLVTDPGPFLGRADDDDPAVRRDADAVDETALRHPVDETRGVAQGDVEQLGEARHREVA